MTFENSFNGYEVNNSILEITRLNTMAITLQTRYNALVEVHKSHAR